jgi:hypothetical protein
MMTRRALWIISLAVVPMALGAQSPPSVPKPGPEQKRLEVFLGKWNVDGQAQASPYGPAGKLTSVDTWAWMPGGFFMTHHWDSKQGGVEIRGMEVLGYDGRSKVYTSRFFDNFGNSGPWKGTVQGNAWTWTGDTEVAGKPLKERCTTVVAGADALTSKCEYSTDGAKWLPNVELKYTRGR